MATPELLVIPVTLSANQPPFTVTPAFSNSHTPSSGSFRTSSEDTAVTIFSMYAADARENWGANTKVLALSDIEPISRARRRSVDSTQGSYSWRGTSNNGRKQNLAVPMRRSSSSENLKPTQPPPSPQNGPTVPPEAMRFRQSVIRPSEDSTSLPYIRDSLDPPDVELISPPEPPPPPANSLSHHSAQNSIAEVVNNIAPPLPLVELAHTSSNGASDLQRSADEDPDSFHVRSTYAQLDIDGVRGDGYEEGVELTRAKEGGTVYLTPRQHDRGRIVAGDLSEKELAVLGNLDRYGFIITPSTSSDRLLLLSSSSLRKPLSAVRRSSPSPSSPTPPTLSSFPPPELSSSARAKELSRSAKWGRMLETDSHNGSGSILAWRVAPSKEHKFRSRIYKCIPDAWRAAAWGLSIGRFARVAQSHEELTRQYRETLDRPSTFDIQIDLDVPRTIAGHVLFRTRYGLGQRSLFHVLHAFSLFCPDCGYVQGMGPIAATLLCYYDPETVYVILVHLHDAYGMHSVFSPGFPGLLESIYVQERVMARLLPDVYALFKRHAISSTSYTTKWYITLFANTVPFQTQLRLWDAFFLEGSDMMIIVAIAILWAFQKELTAATASFETILSLLSSFFVPESDDMLMKWIERALGDKKLRADMQMWRREWRDFVAQGRDGDLLL